MGPKSERMSERIEARQTTIYNHKYIFRMRRLYRYFVCGVISAAMAFAADPDFSGTWTLNETSSEQPRLPVEAWRSIKIDHKDTHVRCVPGDPMPDSKKTPMVMNFVTTGKETAHPLGNASGKSIAKWEGSALLINTLVSGPRSYTQMDRWKLSRDGMVLTIRRQIVNLHGESESILVYERDLDKKQ